MENMEDFCVSHNYTQRDLLLLLLCSSYSSFTCHCGISESEMNEMVNLIPTCIVSNKKLFQDDDSQF
jgi:hypothetical protein